ncbi:hypothetical protein EON82_11375 [bacterium]|nr:MAG: hypothetical protein EON82_11375 [bacterium]
MITSFVASLALLGLQEGRWLPTSVTPDLLVRRVDDRLATLSKATLTYQYNYDKKSVGSAYAVCEGTIVKPGVFWLQVPQMVPTRERDPMNRERWISDGKHFGMSTEPKFPTPGPLAKRPGVPAKPASIWFTDFSRVIFSGLGQKTNPMQKFLKDALGQGFKPNVLVRSLTFRGEKIISYQLNLAKGPIKYQVVIDGRGWLPVSVLNTIGKDATRWTAVKWNLRPGKSLNPAKVKFIKQGATTAFSPKPPQR